MRVPLAARGGSRHGPVPDGGVGADPDDFGRTYSAQASMTSRRRSNKASHSNGRSCRYIHAPSSVSMKSEAPLFERSSRSRTFMPPGLWCVRLFTLLVRLLGSWGAARRWLRENDFIHGLGPGPRREPKGNRGPRRNGRSGNVGGPGADHFWNPVHVHRSEAAASPAPTPPVADLLELWPEETADVVIRRNRAAAARHRAEEECRWEEEMAKLSPGERNYREAQRWKRRRR